MKKTVLFTLLAFSTINMYAYQWLFSNWTNYALIVQVELSESTSPYFVYVAPQKSADFDWSIGNPKARYCIGAIKYLVIKNVTRDPLLTKLKFNKIIVDDKVTDNQKMLEFCDQFIKTYPRQEAHLRFLPDELYDKTVDAIKKAVGMQVGAKIVGWFTDVSKESSCRSRDITIAQNNTGYIGFYTLAN